MSCVWWSSSLSSVWPSRNLTRSPGGVAKWKHAKQNGEMWVFCIFFFVIQFLGQHHTSYEVLDVTNNEWAWNSMSVMWSSFTLNKMANWSQKPSITSGVRTALITSQTVWTVLITNQTVWTVLITSQTVWTALTTSLNYLLLLSEHW